MARPVCISTPLAPRHSGRVLNFMKCSSKIWHGLGAVALGASLLTGCVSEQRRTTGMGDTLTPLYHYPMAASGGYDLIFCSGAFMRKNERWPKDYHELSDFVEQSGGYLALGKYERVAFTELPNDAVQIIFVPHGSTNELKFSVTPGPREK
jgi:hypothetical protein